MDPTVLAGIAVLAGLCFGVVVTAIVTRATGKAKVAQAEARCTESFAEERGRLEAGNAESQRQLRGAETRLRDLEKELKNAKAENQKREEKVAKREELATLAAKLEGIYGKGKWCGADGKARCRDLQELSDVLDKSRNYDELLDAWQGWHTISRVMRPAGAAQLR